MHSRLKRAAGQAGKRPNRELRAREYLTDREVQALLVATGKVGRYGHRDATLILLAYRHGLRVSEVVALASLRSKAWNFLIESGSSLGGMSQTMGITFFAPSQTPPSSRCT